MGRPIKMVIGYEVAPLSSPGSLCQRIFQQQEFGSSRWPCGLANCPLRNPGRGSSPLTTPTQFPVSSYFLGGGPSMNGLSEYPERLGWCGPHDAVDGLRAEVFIRRKSPKHQCHVRIFDRKLALRPSADADLERR